MMQGGIRDFSHGGVQQNKSQVEGGCTKRGQMGSTGLQRRLRWECAPP